MMQPEKPLWTLAYRKKRANKFHRIDNWSGTWHQARVMSQVFGDANPGLDVWYVPTYEAEQAGYSNSDPRDIGHILTRWFGPDSKRNVYVRMTNTGTMPAELLDPALFAAAEADIESRTIRL